VSERVQLLLARHGQTEWNAIRRFQGSSDLGLSDLGRRQAEALGRAVLGRRLASVYTSPLRRAVETAEIALRGRRVPLTVVPELVEFGLGEWEGRSVEEIKNREGDPYQRWVEAPLDHPPPGSETLPRVAARVRHAIDRIARAHGMSTADGEVLVVAHGGVISVYACHLLGLSLNAIWRLRFDNASITVVAPPRLLSTNDTAHLLP
jgi:alpha-ribazole phosphatase/probable phosphoglycerate mutase